MPVKSNIEFGSGSLYFKGLDEPLEILEGFVKNASLANLPSSLCRLSNTMLLTIELMEQKISLVD
jgi:hypothetical protein